MTNAATKTLRLYELADSYEAVATQLIENGGEVTAEIQAALDAIDEQANAKAEKVALYIQNVLATAKAAASEAERLSGIAQTHEKAAAGLKDYLKLQLKRLGLQKIETPLVRIRIQNNPVSVKWSGAPEDIPQPYRLEKTVYSLNREKVLADVEAQVALPVGLTADRGDHLRIA